MPSPTTPTLPSEVARDAAREGEVMSDGTTAFERVPATCQDVADVLGVLQEKYAITDEDVDFARKMIKRLATGRLREALIESIAREAKPGTLTNGAGIELNVRIDGGSVKILYDPNLVAVLTADNGVIFHKRDAEDKYPCNKCGKFRTKAEGGTVFSVCEECWEQR
jgi:hypothetical protein